MTATRHRRKLIALIVAAAAVPWLRTSAAPTQPAAKPTATQHDGAHDFDFLIGDWKAHVRRLPERLTGSTHWIDYDGISNHKKLLDSNANFEESSRSKLTTRA